MTTCAAPGKIMLAGEYAVIDGSDAIMLAVNRYAVATVKTTPQHLSPFLLAARDVVAARFGEESLQAEALRRVRVDTSTFREGELKLGIGSSAAATVAAIGAALGSDFDVDLVQSLSRQAHGDAQQASGSRGSGADIACSCHGGCLLFNSRAAGTNTSRILLPHDLHLVFPFCGQSASTTELVAKVRAFRSSQPRVYAAHCRDIASSASALASANDASSAIAAIDAGGRAVATLGSAAAAPIWLPIHTVMHSLATELGGALKPTGAGGGDLALGAFDSADKALQFVQHLADRKICCPELAGSKQGVRLGFQTSKVAE